ncbi:hypothetical protein VL20_1916 [Microcystis panniformis FACHB-1757]|uniref:Uncharacterized protein n=1 Tax=Microcystis panniformis FACHB-1757 TaxID=1638788 RepID=A0A0K1RYT9_9CHRO|nr:hypothetical protein VL20_1916 [Microcystis panniformis FACHB-1757]
MSSHPKGRESRTSVIYNQDNLLSFITLFTQVSAAQTLLTIRQFCQPLAV